MGRRGWLRCCGVALACALATTAWAQEPAREPSFLGRAFDAFDVADQAGLPPPGGVLFVGSSSIAFWPDLRAEFEEHPVLIQRGIAGSRMADLALHADRLAIRYQPSRIVIYSGENDIAEGLSSLDVLDALRSFVTRVRAELPHSWIAWVSIKPSPARWASDARFRETNALIAAWIAEQEGMEYIGLHRRMLGPDGLPRSELYAADGLHLSAAGYALWEEEIESRLRRALLAVER